MKGKINGVMGSCKASSLNLKASKKAMKKQPSSTADADGGSSSNRCCECGKVFKSCKALYGHMRCHPERGWRGSKNFVGVAVRTPKALIDRPLGNAVGFSSYELEAAESLLLLAGGPCLVKVPRAASVNPKPGFGLKDELFLAWEVVPCSIEGHLGATECSAQATESEVETLASVQEEEELNVEVSVSVPGHDLCLARGSWEKCARALSGARLDLNQLPGFTEENSIGRCSAVKASGLDLRLRL